MWPKLRDFFARELLILIDPTHDLHRRRKRQIVSVVGSVLTLGMVTAFGIAPMVPDAALRGDRVQMPIAFPDLTPQIRQIDAHEQTFVSQASLQRGDTVDGLLQRLSINDPQAERFIQADRHARALFHLPSEQLISAVTDDAGKLLSLTAMLSFDAEQSRELKISRNAQNRLGSSVNVLPNETQWDMRSGTIDDNFFRAMDDAGVPESVVAQMVRIFSGVVNFHKDVRRGDRFRLVFENIQQQGRTVRYGRVLAVEFVNRGKTYQTVWYAEPGQASNGTYYTFDGKHLRQAFLRTPVEFSRLTSGFGTRNHPLFQDWRQHNGVDFAAPVGTRVFAAGDGTVSFVGQQNGYGNIVMINHAGGYSTRYAHLSGFAPGVRAGQRVAQGAVIGFVGQTGWATGPHLHYELRYRGQPLNPFATSFAAAPPLDGKRLERFNLYTTHLLKRIDLMRTVHIAQIS